MRFGRTLRSKNLTTFASKSVSPGIGDGSGSLQRTPGIAHHYYNRTFPPRGHLSENEYRIAFLRDSTDFGAAYNLCLILCSRDRKSEVLQILESVTKQASCPDYFYVMKGDLLASRGDWSGAWEAIAGLLH